MRKVLRYRDQTGASLEEHTTHWRGFEWQAGPVIVAHVDADWGNPQVWAASATEGKRVLRHAGVIAGIDVDEVGRFVVTGSLNPRYGRTGTMLVKGLANGAVSVTKRDGPNGLPQVATPDP